MVAFICGAMARDMSLSCNGPVLREPGAIPTVDFLLYRLAAVVKKMSVKSHVGVVLAFTRQIARGMAETPEPCRSGADARMRMC